MSNMNKARRYARGLQHMSIHVHTTPLTLFPRFFFFMQEGWTALHSATEYGQAGVAELLMASRCSVQLAAGSRRCQYLYFYTSKASKLTSQ